MGMRKGYVRKESSVGGKLWRPNSYEVFRNIGESLIDPVITLPEGYIRFSQGMFIDSMEFKIDMTDDVMSTFRRSFFELYEPWNRADAYFRKRIESDGKVFDYSVHVKGGNLVLKFPKRIIKRLRPEETANGYVFHEFSSLPFYKRIGLDESLRIGAEVIDDAMESFGFEKVDLRGPSMNQRVINVCVRPREIKCEAEFFDMFERSLYEGADFLVEKAFVGYDDENVGGYNVKIGKKDKGVRAEGELRIKHKHLSRLQSKRNDPLYMFMEGIPEDARIEYGAYEMRDWWTKLADFVQKAADIALSPFSMAEHLEKYVDRAVENYKQRRVLENRIREEVVTEYLKKHGIPENKENEMSCLVGLTPLALEEIEAEVKKRLREHEGNVS